MPWNGLRTRAQYNITSHSNFTILYNKLTSSLAETHLCHNLETQHLIIGCALKMNAQQNVESAYSNSDSSISRECLQPQQMHLQHAFFSVSAANRFHCNLYTDLYIFLFTNTSTSVRVNVWLLRASSRWRTCRRLKAPDANFTLLTPCYIVSHVALTNYLVYFRKKPSVSHSQGNPCDSTCAVVHLIVRTIKHQRFIRRYLLVVCNWLIKGIRIKYNAWCLKIVKSRHQNKLADRNGLLLFMVQLHLLSTKTRHR